MPAGERLFFSKPAQLLAGVDWQAAPAKTGNTKIIVRHALKGRIVTSPFQFGLAVGNSLLRSVPVVSGAVTAPMADGVGERACDESADGGTGPDLEPSESSEHRLSPT